MPFVPFYQRFPEIAEEETRVLTILPGANRGLISGEYVFQEMYCDEPDCDCRRVFFYVTSSKPNVADAVITYGWETSSFYAKWIGDDDPKMLADLTGPCLNLGSPQSRLAPAILEFTKDVLLKDPAYVRRIKRHYQMFREQIDKSKTSKKRRRRILSKGKGFG
jgi:hypothetical protein